MAWIAPVAGAALAGLSNVFSGFQSSSVARQGAQASLEATRETNQMERDLMNQSEAYNTQMSNTAWQRGAADMRAAGINPMVMANQGGGEASSPTVSIPQAQSGAQAVMSSALERADIIQKTADKVGGAVADAISERKTMADTESAYATKKLAESQRATADSQTLVNNTSAERIEAERRRVDAQTRLFEAYKPKADAEAKLWREHPGLFGWGSALGNIGGKAISAIGGAGGLFEGD